MAQIDIRVLHTIISGIEKCTSQELSEAIKFLTGKSVVLGNEEACKIILKKYPELSYLAGQSTDMYVGCNPSYYFESNESYKKEFFHQEEPTPKEEPVQDSEVQEEESENLNETKKPSAKNFVQQKGKRGRKQTSAPEPANLIDDEDE